jgi:hypothetical protein
MGCPGACPQDCPATPEGRPQCGHEGAEEETLPPQSGHEARDIVGEI